MKVKELIKQLSYQDKNAEIYIEYANSDFPLIISDIDSEIFAYENIVRIFTDNPPNIIKKDKINE